MLLAENYCSLEGKDAVWCFWGLYLYFCAFGQCDVISVQHSVSCDCKHVYVYLELVLFEQSRSFQQWNHSLFSTACVLSHVYTVS